MTSSEPSQSQIPEPINSSMEEYYQLKKQLLLITLVMSGAVFVCVGLADNFNTAFNYLLGAGFGTVYLSMLAKDVEKLGIDRKPSSWTRLALFAGIIIVATQWQILKILPIFLGFITYKAAIIFYVLQTNLRPAQK